MYDINYEMGKVVRLTDAITVTLGHLVDIRLHPSGSRFDGPAGRRLGPAHRPRGTVVGR